MVVGRARLVVRLVDGCASHTGLQMYTSLLSLNRALDWPLAEARGLLTLACALWHIVLHMCDLSSSSHA